MLRELKASDPRFRAISFTPGLNLLLADRTSASTEDQSRNAVGKTSMVELLHFLLGADKTPLVTRGENKGTTFELVLDWPEPVGRLSVRRSGSDPKKIYLDPDIRGHDPDVLIQRAGVSGVKEWRSALERELFGIRDADKVLSGRLLLGFYLRRTEKNGFADALRPNPQTSRHLATANLCHLLGMDWALAARYGELAEREQTRRKLARATDDPVWKDIVGKSGDLRGQLIVIERRIADLKAQISDFQVVPEYEEIRREAERVDSRIRQLREADVIGRRNLADIERSIEEADDPGHDYLERAYQEMGVLLGDQVRARFDQVEAFHRAVVRNRRRYLNEEAAALREKLTTSEREREDLGARQAALLRTLNEGGALDTLTVMQGALAKEEAQREYLQSRLNAARTLEQSRRQIDQEKAALEEEVQSDIEARREQEQQANLLFNRFAEYLYGDARAPYLTFQARRSHLEIELKLEADDSTGISNMKMFCFDLAWAVIAHRAGRGPDFLVHDSKIYDGVDERQVARALELAAMVAQEEGMQYVVTMNSDDLVKAERMGFDAMPYIIEPKLDDSEAGGLFGFRF
ncbi:ABC-three component system protein [Nocardiopsis alkaliphila]|uniref:ABC-three component system protein n=1 Tax=Nocardiopsis alkaliphila TaxID=225762 RepID=UPI000344F85D|nr:ABC-three component system protein [Nocardiopsis alkaliphila]